MRRALSLHTTKSALHAKACTGCEVVVIQPQVIEAAELLKLGRYSSAKHVIVQRKII